MINGMTTLPAALGSQLGLSLQGHNNINHQLNQLSRNRSAFGISGGRSRMPDAHVEMLLDCYKLVQEERTLDSGRLGKGAFHQITEQLNKRTVGNYCKDQVTAKLQNLKAQFRQRRAAVEAGHGEMRDWKWYDRMAEIMSEGKEETSTFSDFSNNESRVKTPPQMTQGKNIGQYPSPFGLNNNLGKILGNLPPQIRENPAALAQIMNGSPLFGLPGMSNPLLGIPNLPKPATPYESDEEDKNKIQNQIRDNKNQVPIGGLLHQQQQNAALQRTLMARVQAQSQIPQVPQNHLKSPIPKSSTPENSLKRPSEEDMSYSQMKRARQSPPTEIPMALESTLANLASFMPRTPENLPMMNARKDCLSSLRNLAFQLFTGLSAVLAQMETPVDSTIRPKPVEPVPVPVPEQPVLPVHLQSSQPQIPRMDIQVENSPKLAEETEPIEEIEANEESENSKVSEIQSEDAEN